MTITSATTAAAFYANLISPIMPIRAFGVFAGTLIPVNFLLVVLMMPPTVIYYEAYLKHKKCCCCCNRKTATGEKITDDNNPDKIEVGQDSHSKIEKFFDTRWNTFVHSARYPIIVITLGWFVATLLIAPNMGPQTEQPEFISEDNPIWKPIAVMGEEFPASDDSYVDVSVFWGTKDIDREGENQWDPDFIGEL